MQAGLTQLLFFWQFIVVVSGYWEFGFGTVSISLQRRKLAISLTFALSLLFLTKYCDFFREIINPIFSNIGFAHTLPIIRFSYTHRYFIPYFPSYFLFDLERAG
jgi:hypothetical protein